MRTVTYKISLFLLIVLPVISPAQNTQSLDSLRQLFANAVDKQDKWEHLKSIAKYFEKLNMDSALVYSNQLVRYSENELPAKLPEAYLLHGWNCQLALDFEQGLSAYFKALELAEKTGRKELLPEIYLNLAQLEEGREDFKKAKQYLQQALSQAQEQRDSLTIMKVYNTFGNVSRKSEEHDSTLFYYQKSLELAEGWGKDYYILRAVNNIGTHYHVNGELEKAIPYYQRASELALKTGEKTSRVFPVLNIGHAYLSLDKPDQAIPYFLEAKQLAEEASHKMGQGSVAMGLANAYKKKGDFEKAYEYQEEYLNISNEITEKRYNDQIAEIQTRFETQQKEAQLAQKDLELTRQENFTQRILIAAAILLLGLAGLFLFFRYRQRMRRQEAELLLKLEQDKARHLEELDSLKSNFFANISHEFRTPLTLILGPVQQALQTIPVSEKVDEMAEIPMKGKHLEVVRRNALRLQNLIDQLLDLSKLDSGKLTLQASPGKLILFIRSLVFSFESLAERKRIHLQTTFPPELSDAYFDKDKWEKILVNLLSNAFKFTPENGTIRVEVKEVDAGLRIDISDSGKGMEASETSKIFDRFYQVKMTGHQEESPGTGIGLSLVKELVELHRGQISVESRPGIGTTFSLTLPFKRSAFAENEVVSPAVRQFDSSTVGSRQSAVGNHTEYNTNTEWRSRSEFGTGSDELKTDELRTDGLRTGDSKPTLLIVEDNPDLRHFIADIMQDSYQILLAENGKIGLEAAIEHTPDLLISDVMMPEMDGFAMCESLKKNEHTSHIPIILLTAKADQRHKVEGLETGADAYLTKPFDEKELRVRAKNLVEQRGKLQAYFAKVTSRSEFGRLPLEPSEVHVTSTDQRFLEKVSNSIEENMGNEFFSVEDLASAVAFSRSQLHRKLKALTGKSPNELIRDFRLARAKELLEKGAGNVSEVAMEVGYSSVSYFTKSFKQAFGVLPSEV
ncbi:MAG: ATP-binding protein [Saprospiraceae bacterium]